MGNLTSNVVNPIPSESIYNSCAYDDDSAKFHFLLITTVFLFVSDAADVASVWMRG